MNNFIQITPVSDESVSEPASKMECDDGEISRVIYPLSNDIKSIALYEEMSHPRSTVGNNGLLIRFLYAMDMNYKVVVVVPSKRWGNKIKKLVPSNKNVVRFDGKMKNIEKKDMSSTDVLIYTCGFSAGNPIEIKNHFHCLFVIVESPVIEMIDEIEMWKIPDLKEVSQLARQVRYPITPNVYLITTEGIDGSKKPVKLTTTGYRRLDADEFRTIVENSPARAIGLLSRYEFDMFVEKCFSKFTFPGSRIEGGMLGENVFTMNWDEMNRRKERNEIIEFCSKDEKRAKLFEEIEGGWCRKRVGKETVNSFPDLNFFACKEEGIYVVLLDEGGSGQIF
ncbi:tc_p019c [Abalone herpesvirus Taiwan/2004]|nr:tc_p019c [Abalone herpesvirus Taiwan/2004]UCX57013.1 ORF23 [Haliotid herpesvirus 1]